MLQRDNSGLKLYPIYIYIYMICTKFDELAWNFRIIDPLVFGDYPKTMKKIVGSRLPVFSKSESEYLKGSFDFLGVNHYT